MNKNRKGFTIVELVIVIAIIAILAAVLIPTFASLIAKANVSVDTQLVRNLNNALTAEKAGGENNKTMYDALMMVKSAGYDIDTIVSKSGNNIAWDSKNDRFVLIDPNNNTYIYPTESGAGSQTIATPVDFFVIYNEVPALETQKYSVYLSKNATVATVEVKVGFDAGENTAVTALTYTGVGTAQNVVIRTNSFDTTVTATAFESGTFGSDDYKCDSIRHFGDAKEVNIIKAGQASYHEFGNVGFTQVASGKFVAEAGSKTNTVVATSEYAVIDINGGEIEHKYATDASFGESNSKGNVELDVIAPFDVEQKKQDAIDEVTPAPEDPYLALVDTIEKDPRAATAIYAAVISGETTYVFDSMPEAIADQSITIILLNNNSNNFVLGVNSNITIDINGKSWSVMGDGIGAARGTMLTIKDTKGTGSVLTTSIAPFGSTIIIESGSYTFDEFGMNGNMFGTVIVTGGTFNVDPTKYVNTADYNVTKNGDVWEVTTK